MAAETEHKDMNIHHQRTRRFKQDVEKLAQKYGRNLDHDSLALTLSEIVGTLLAHSEAANESRPELARDLIEKTMRENYEAAKKRLAG